MFKTRILIGPFGEKSPLFILALVLMLTVSFSKVAQSQEAETDEQKQVAQKLAQKFIQDGIAQYNQGYFKAAELSPASRSGISRIFK